VAELVVAVEVAVPASEVWAKLVDWPTHGRWMLLTAVESTTAQTHGVGAGIVGVTGFGPLRVRDPMVIAAWEPPPASPARCAVEHTGKVVKGAGAFEVEPIDASRSRVIWSEWVCLPLGLLGQLGWLAVRPALVWSLRLSLRRFARFAESGRS
jgi:Polyketide cyclase / dehydrase and lipid transport